MSCYSCSCWIILSLIIVIYLSALAAAQQPYTASNCSSNDPSQIGYACNGLNHSCQAYLTYIVQPPYTNNLSAIATLFSASLSSLSLINSLPANASSAAANQTVIVPVTCSCSGPYYQANTTYVVSSGQTVFIIGNDVFEYLTTCAAVESANGDTSDIFVSQDLTIPLRCACPTQNQTNDGIGYLLTYVVQTGDTVSSIAMRFGADIEETLEGNELSVENSDIISSSTLLVPLRSPPNSSSIVSPAPSPPSQSPPPAAESPPINSSRHRWDYFGGGVAAGAVFVIVVGGGLLFCLWRRGSVRKKGTRRQQLVIPGQSFGAQDQKTNTAKPAGADPQELLSSNILISLREAKSLKIYSIKELQSATGNFSPSSWMGGCVYRGIVGGGETVAIKKAEGDVAQEINLLKNINHSNLISLLGVCFEQGQWYLIYEYAGNGPLSDWIYHQEYGAGSGNVPLSWTQRTQIAFDATTGLDYLHSYATPPLVHRDIKSSNILLDSNFRAKIGSFGQSRSVGDDPWEFTRHVAGTKGYMAPEYLENGLITFKLDVYSLGVVLLEILTGKRAGELCEEGDGSELSEVVENMIPHNDGDAREKLRSVIDPCLHDMYPAEAAVIVLRLAGRCLRKDPGGRPSMEEAARAMSRSLNISLNWESTRSRNSASFVLSSSSTDIGDV